jgi:hypothetical protein
LIFDICLTITGFYVFIVNELYAVRS